MNISKFFLLSILMLLLSTGLAGCNSGGGGNGGGGGGGGGGGNLFVGEIEGPGAIDENASAQFGITASGDTGITYAWLVNPPDLGDFNAPSASDPVLTAAAVDEQTQVEITVVVQSTNSEPVVKQKTVTINDVTGLWVGEIIGADEIDEHAWAIYSVDAGGDFGITYTWTSSIPTIGGFESPDMEETKYSISTVAAETLVEIRVEVQSDSFGPVQRTKNVFVHDLAGLWASVIDGPEEIDEGSSGTFMVEAGGDVGIVYAWTCEPSGAGEFASPNDPTTDFTAAMVSEDTPVEIRVGVASAAFIPAKQRTKNITIINEPELIAGEIDGPTQLMENTSEIYSIDASGDTGITYAWICTPPDAGEFDDPMSADPVFTAYEVDDNIEVELKAIIYSDNFGPEIRNKNVTIFNLTSGGWARVWGGIGEDQGSATAVDKFGNIYTTGYFSGEVDFDPGGDFYTGTSEGDLDIFLSKFSYNGEFQWAFTWGGLQRDEGRAVAVDDATGDIYVSGSFNDTVDFDPGAGTDIHGNGGMFLSRFDSSGDFQWAHTWGVGSDTDYVNRTYDLAIDESGNVYVTGIIRDVVDFDPGTGVDEHGNIPGVSAFLCKYNSDGEYLWTRAWGPGTATEFCHGRGVAVDGSGNAYVTGSFAGITDFDPGPVVDNHSTGFDIITGYAVDAFLCKYNPDGDFQWAHDWGGDTYYAYGDYGTGIAYDNSGNLYIVGHFGGTVDFDPGSGVTEHSGLQDAYLSKFTTDGEFEWVRLIDYGYESLDYGKAVTVSAGGAVYVTGSTGEPYNIFVDGFEPDGDSLFNITLGGYGKQRGNDIVTDGGGSLYVSGYFAYDVDFEPGSGVTEYSSNGHFDCFLLKLLPAGTW